MKDSRLRRDEPSPQPPPDREGELAARCPRCSAEPGAPCKDRSGKVLEKIHAGRTTMPPAVGERTFDRAIDWAKRSLPGEHPPFVAYAAMALKSGGWPVTAESVLRKLRGQGCDMASLEALGERFAEQEKRS
jgi:hypothetical protein